MFLPTPEKGTLNLRGRAAEHYFRLRKFGKKLPLRFLAVKLIAFYQKYLSKGTCLYEPTCSHYMMESIHNNGFFVGVLLGILRLLRCNPLSKGGYDPPKENFILYIWLI